MVYFLIWSGNGDPNRPLALLGSYFEAMIFVLHFSPFSFMDLISISWSFGSSQAMIFWDEIVLG
jgi:hypothetical protein